MPSASLRIGFVRLGGPISSGIFTTRHGVHVLARSKESASKMAAGRQPSVSGLKIGFPGQVPINPHARCDDMVLCQLRQVTDCDIAGDAVNRRVVEAASLFIPSPATITRAIKFDDSIARIFCRTCGHVALRVPSDRETTLGKTKIDRLVPLSPRLRIPFSAIFIRFILSNESILFICIPHYEAAAGLVPSEPSTTGRAGSLGFRDGVVTQVAKA